jgi:methionyl-tRNA formyltransferase
MNKLKIALFCDNEGLRVGLPVLRDHLVAVVVAAPIALPSDFPGNVVVLNQKKSSDINFSSFLKSFEALNIDVIVCCSYAMKIPYEVTSCARIDAVNIHGGLLPECRGANILNWVLINDLSKSGSTMHILSEGFDQGDIIFRDEISISDTDDAISLRSKLSPLASDQIRRALEYWEKGLQVPRYKQDESKAKYLNRRRPEDGLFDWSFSDRQIFNLIRALVHPWPGARFIDANGQLTILDSYMTMAEVQSLRATQSNID